MQLWKPTWGTIGQLDTHQGYVFNPKTCGIPIDLSIASVASFMYLDIPRLAFILNPSYRDPKNGRYKMHALTLKNISRAVLLREIVPNIAIAQHPKVFYETIYKRPVLYSLDAYRTYLVNKVSDITMFQYETMVSDAEFMKEFSKTDGTVDDIQDYFIDKYGTAAEHYREIDRTVMEELFKAGAGIVEVERYYRGVVLKRYVAEKSRGEVQKKFFKEGE